MSICNEGGAIRSSVIFAAVYQAPSIQRHHCLIPRSSGLYSLSLRSIILQTISKQASVITCRWVQNYQGSSLTSCAPVKWPPKLPQNVCEQNSTGGALTRCYFSGPLLSQSFPVWWIFFAGENRHKNKILVKTAGLQVSGDRLLFYHIWKKKSSITVAVILKYYKIK